MNSRVVAGRNYNKLVAVKPTGRSRSDGCVIWECRCECGKTKLLASSRIGRDKSCGCLRTTSRLVAPGDRFGKLIAVSPVDRQNRRGHFYRFKCDCGGEKVASISNVVYGGTRSCGCLARVQLQRIPRRKAFGQSTVYCRYYALKENAKCRGKQFDLTLEQFSAAATQPCFWCGVPAPRVKYKRYYGSAFLHGLDRMDSSKGYTADNVVASCPVCNAAKGRMNAEEFKAWAVRLCRNLFKEVSREI